MMAILIFSGVILYSVGVLTGVYVGFSIKNELRNRSTKTVVPSEVDSTKILDMLAKKKKITNNHVEKLLGVSDATATRYLDALQKRGELRQHGKTGRNVYYTLV